MTIMSGIEGKIGGLDRKSYKEITGRGASIDCAPVFEVASRLQRNPSFGSKHYSTDDVPSVSAAAATSAPQRPLLAQPSHNMFTAPQPGAKPISIAARTPTSRSGTASAITPNIPPSSFLTKLVRPETPTRREPEPRAVKFTAAGPCNHTASRCDVCDPEKKKPDVPGVVAGPCNHAASRCDVCDPEKKKPDAPGVVAGSCNHAIGTVCPACAPVKARPLLQRQLTVNDIAKCQLNDKAKLVKLYDGKRIISDEVAVLMGLKKGALPDITCAEFDALHAHVMANL